MTSIKTSLFWQIFSVASFLCLLHECSSAATPRFVLPSKTFPANVYVRGSYKMAGTENRPRDCRFTYAQLNGRTVYLYKESETMSETFSDGEPTNVLVDTKQTDETYSDHGRVVNVIKTQRKSSEVASSGTVNLDAHSSENELSRSLDSTADFATLELIHHSLSSVVENVVPNSKLVSQSPGRYVYGPRDTEITVLTDKYDRIISVENVYRNTGYPAATEVVKYPEGDGNFPVYFESTVYSKETSGAVRIKLTRQFDEVCFDPETIKEKIRPRPINVGAMLQDGRFKPPVRFELTSNTLPTDEEIFAIGAKQKAEREAQAKRNSALIAAAAVANDPHNVKDVPVTGESWGTRLRSVPNWAYGGAVVLFLGGWFVAASRRRRKR